MLKLRSSIASEDFWSCLSYVTDFTVFFDGFPIKHKYINILLKISLIIIIACPRPILYLFKYFSKVSIFEKCKQMVRNTYDYFIEGLIMIPFFH